MTKKIVWSDKAQHDRKEILLYWNERNKSSVYSRKLNIVIIDATKAIANFPNIGKLTGYKTLELKLLGII